MKKIFVIALLLLSACSKITQQERIVGGLQPDDPVKVAKVPLIVSTNYLKPTSYNQLDLSYRGKPNKDNVYPQVSFISPVSGTTVTDLVNIQVQAADNIGVASVAISINGVLTFTKTVAPYTFVWNTASLPNGTYTITATVKDAARNTTISSVSVVKNVIVVDPPDTTTYGYKIFTPPIGYQGGEGSCVAFSVGYAARAIDYYYKNGQSNSLLFSPEFLYNQIKFSTDCNSGTAMQTALDFIKVNGICTYEVMPYSSTNGCSLLPNDVQQANALNYKIEDYYKIYTSDTAAMKSMIRLNRPVIVSINLDNAFLNAGYGFVWSYTGSGLGIGHSVILCGYDDTKEAWLVMNSFGTSWGTNGFCWMKYDMFPTRTGTYCYTIK